MQKDVQLQWIILKEIRTQLKQFQGLQTNAADKKKHENRPSVQFLCSIEDLLSMMKKYEADYTNTFLALTFDTMEETVLFGTAEFSKWKDMWQARLGKQQETKADSHQLMRNSNPALIPRNHQVEAALEASVKNGDNSVTERILAVLANPFAHTPEQAEYCAVPTESTIPYQTFCGT